MVVCLRGPRISLDLCKSLEEAFLSDCGKVNVSAQILKEVTCLNKPKR